MNTSDRIKCSRCKMVNMVPKTAQRVNQGSGGGRGSQQQQQQQGNLYNNQVRNSSYNYPNNSPYNNYPYNQQPYPQNPNNVYPPNGFSNSGYIPPAVNLQEKPPAPLVPQNEVWESYEDFEKLEKIEKENL